jgi:hypothetical protein
MHRPLFHVRINILKTRVSIFRAMEITISYVNLSSPLRFTYKGPCKSLNACRVKQMHMHKDTRQDLALFMLDFNPCSQLVES